MTESLTRKFAEKLTTTRVDDLPPDAIEVARQVLLDALGVSVAGVAEPSGLGRITIDYTASLGGKADASVIGGGFKTSVPNAAYANGTLCHALDYDNTWWPRNHPASPSLPAILAVAERDGASGAEVLRAIVLAFEVQGRIRLASQGAISGGPFHHPGVSGAMGAVAGAGVLLGLSAAQLCMAFGNAGSRAGTVTANHGTMTKPSHSGIGARMGVEAALLAARGFTASDDIFGAGELLQTFYGAVNCDPGLLVAGFGAPYRMVTPGVAFKQYPAKYSCHRGIEAAITLSGKHGLLAKDIDRVEVEYPPTKLVDRPRPRSGLDGKFSLQYGVAAGLLDRRVGIDTFVDSRRFAPDMVDLLDRITIAEDPSIPRDFADAWIVVRVRTHDGQVLEERCADLKGRAGHPPAREDRLRKFRDCVADMMPDADAEKCIRTVENLAGQRTIRPLMTLLRNAATG
ncbi:MAG: MmgE/PrpD family protein [Alphaproteobacteria bacterium]|nr:MmgE/PrpD family protein [Alphaproteobacteria bacterium]